MNYQDTIKSSIKRSQIKYLILYAILLLLCGLGAYAFFVNGQRIKLLDLIPVPAAVSGTVFVILSAFLLNLIVQTLRSLLHQKVYSGLLESIKIFGNPDSVFSHVEQLPKSNLCAAGDFRCDKKYVAFFQGDLVLLQPTRQIVWGYLPDTIPKASRRSLIGPAAPKEAKSVVLRLAGRQTLTLHTKNKENSEKLLSFVQECCPTMTTGYSVKYESVYAKNPENLRKSAAK